LDAGERSFSKHCCSDESHEDSHDVHSDLEGKEFPDAIEDVPTMIDWRIPLYPHLIAVMMELKLSSSRIIA
jgi:hypothetical protein